MEAHRADRRLQRLTAHVVEVHVDAVGRELAQRVAGGRSAVVETPSRPSSSSHATFSGVPALPSTRRAAKRASCAAALPDGARRPGDEHRLAFADARDVVDSHERGQAGHAEHAERGRDRRDRRIDRAHAPPVGERDLAPAEPVHDPGALVEPLVPRRDHLPDRATHERLSDLERRNVRLDVVHPSTHVRIHRDEGVADHDLAFARDPGRPRRRARSRPASARPVAGGKPYLARADRHGPDPRGSISRGAVLRIATLTESSNAAASLPRGLVATGHGERSSGRR